MTDHAHTLLILTGEESRLIRKGLLDSSSVADARAAREAYDRGITRGTERLAAEFSEEQRKRKARKP